MHNLSKTLRDYYDLAKPGMIYGNLVTTSAGFLFGTIVGRAPFEPGLFLAVVIGTALIIGSGCVFNNYIDRGIDASMSRTKDRALVRELISGRNALTYGTILAVLGFAMLLLYANFLTVWLEIGGFFFYVALYSLSKRRSIYGVVVGSVSGAVPITAGYCAAFGTVAMTGYFDIAACILFLILVLWQVPHFYAIALYRSDEYRAAGLPLLPLVKGVRRTRMEMLIYIVAFSVAVVSLSVLGYAGYAYLVVLGCIGAGWMVFCVRGFFIKDDSAALNRWARGMFLYSLVVIMVFSVMLSLG